jgi:mRNA-degrading endonuclease RelE of RelBE toxin-antitoxin system
MRCAILIWQMTGKDQNALERVEAFVRRALERFGAAIDNKLAPESQAKLSLREISELLSRLEREIEANLREDESGLKRIAPNRFRILFTYEDSTRLGEKYLKVLAEELKAAAYEFIKNRRYQTLGPIEIETGQDLFSKTTVIKVVLEEIAQPHSENQVTDHRRIELRSAAGQRYCLKLKSGAAPSYIGRAAENSIRIDDPSVSRLHCSIALRGNGEVVISDLNSSNGTFVNGAIVSPGEARAIKLGDTIRVGEVNLIFAESD